MTGWIVDYVSEGYIASSTTLDATCLGDAIDQATDGLDGRYVETATGITWVTLAPVWNGEPSTGHEIHVYAPEYAFTG